MSKAIEQMNGLTRGHAALGFRSGVTGTVRQQVHDGDTINVRAVGNLGVRFLGVDAPEISFTLPGSTAFTGLSHPSWSAFLANPLSGATFGAFDQPLTPGLTAHLRNGIRPNTALNHHQHASAAEDELEKQVQDDIAALSLTPETFQFFLAFAHEVIDRYGRLLCYVNREQPDPNSPAARPRSYNERLLATGYVSPYFIWPNVNPFRRPTSILDAVKPPAQFMADVAAEGTFQWARNAVKAARMAHTGIFDANGPLLLEPFEVRFLARRRAPDRWLIDLSSANPSLIPPQDYHTVSFPEDRLFIPPEYVCLFRDAGWP